jgi:hypothetical protein
MYDNLVEKKVSREYRYLHGTGTVIKGTVVVPWYRQYRPSLMWRMSVVGVGAMDLHVHGLPTVLHVR